MHYCSQDCQKTDWNIHRYECANLKKLTEAGYISIIDDDLVRLLMRVLIRAKNGETALSDAAGLKTLDTLMDRKFMLQLLLLRIKLHVFFS